MIRRAYDLAFVLFTVSACLVVPVAARQQGLDAWAVAGLIVLVVAVLLIILIDRRELRAKPPVPPTPLSVTKGNTP